MTSQQLPGGGRALRGAVAFVHVWIPLDEDLAIRARELRTEYELGALDALHVAAAEVGMVDQFVTTEKPGKPLYRVAPVGLTYLGDL